jgi:D-glycero-alpha-D-manno-heptose-7-phosphate kinase
VTSWVRVRAPVRVLDAGGWTDTWFARQGAVCHLAVGPGAEAFVQGSRLVGTGNAEVRLRVGSFGDDYTFALSEPPGRHRMLEAALRRWAPPGCSFEVSVESSVPAGSSLGTSASVLVSVVAALEVLAGREPRAGALAHAAHEVETVDLGRQSGIQDQIAAAFGGANLVNISPYPEFEVVPLELAPATWSELSRRVMTVYLGSSHDSSAVHTDVIERLSGDQEGAQKLLAPLRDAGAQAAAALIAGDVAGYGGAMIANTEAQSALHPAIVNPLAGHVIELASRHGAIGWKVNGAGGPGGTVTLLGPDDPGPLALALGALKTLTVLPLSPARQGAVVVDRG